MKTFIIQVNIEKEIDAVDEDEALQFFWESMNYNTTPETEISEALKIKEIPYEN